MNRLLAPLLRDPARHLYKLASDPCYRTMARLASRYGRVKPAQPRDVRLHGWTIHAPDVPSFLWAYYWTFVERTYEFRARRPDPLIVDCGANIGLSVLYFKSIYPEARIVAYEADPRIFEVLRRNIEGNGITGVELINQAVGAADGTASFWSQGGDSGRLAVEADRAKDLITVPVVRLCDRLGGREVDLLKMDIEGAEADVLTDCAGAMAGVAAICAEYHSFPGRRQRLGEVIARLEDAGFRAQVTQVIRAGSPLVPERRVLIEGMDVQLHLYFYRP
ncbi:MAG TPA: FkbM family methyltransferase [Tepidisphaeraceae bacterium]|jgi:FkbM family methyltransferase